MIVAGGSGVFVGISGGFVVFVGVSGGCDVFVAVSGRGGFSVGVDNGCSVGWIGVFDGN